MQDYFHPRGRFLKTKVAMCVHNIAFQVSRVIIGSMSGQMMLHAQLLATVMQSGPSHKAYKLCDCIE